MQRLDRELLALVALGVAELRIVITQRQPPERDMARLVLHDIGIDRASQRIALQRAAQPRPLLVGHLAPVLSIEDRYGLVLELHRIVGIELERPVETRRGIPLLLLALLIELEQRRRAVVILPVEGDLGGAV